MNWWTKNSNEDNVGNNNDKDDSNDNEVMISIKNEGI